MKTALKTVTQFVRVLWSDHSRCDGWWRLFWQTKHASERCVDCADSDGVVDQEVAVLYTGELTNCLWAEKAEHWKCGEGKKKRAKRMM